MELFIVINFDDFLERQIARLLMATEKILKIFDDFKQSRAKKNKPV